MNQPTAGELKAARRIANGYRAIIEGYAGGAYDEANDHEQVITKLAQIMADERTS